MSSSVPHRLLAAFAAAFAALGLIHCGGGSGSSNSGGDSGSSGSTVSAAGEGNGAMSSGGSSQAAAGEGNTTAGTRSGSGSGGASAGGGAGPGCEVILNQADADTGLERCDDGTKRRRAALQCPTERTSAESPCMPTAGAPACAVDADCTREPHGYCAEEHKLTGYCGCYYGCQQDSDCEAGELCECGVVLGHCVAATCKSNQDCTPGFGCVGSAEGVAGSTCSPANTAAPTIYVCQSPEDECTGDQDCPGGDRNALGACLFDGNHRVCGTVCQLTPTP